MCVAVCRWLCVWLFVCDCAGVCGCVDGCTVTYTGPRLVLVSVRVVGAHARSRRVASSGESPNPSFFLLRLAPVVVQEEEFEEADAHAETEESLGIQGLFDTSSAAGVRSLASKSGMRGATGKASGLIIAGDGVISKRRSGEVDSDDDDEPAGGAGEGGTGEARGARLVVSLLLPCVLAICSCFGFLVSETAVTEVAAASNAIFE